MLPKYGRTSCGKNRLQRPSSTMIWFSFLLPLLFYSSARAGNNFVLMNLKERVSVVDSQAEIIEPWAFSRSVFILLISASRLYLILRSIHRIFNEYIVSKKVTLSVFNLLKSTASTLQLTHIPSRSNISILHISLFYDRPVNGFIESRYKLAIEKFCFIYVLLNRKDIIIHTLFTLAMYLQVHVLLNSCYESKVF